MSSEAPTWEELYEAERLRAKVLEKKNARLQANLEREKFRLQDDLEQIQEKLDYTEAVSEFKDERLRAQDSTIQELQTALDNTDRPRDSGDDKKVKELEQELSKANTDLLTAKEELMGLQEYNQALQKEFQELLASAENHVRETMDGSGFVEDAVGTILQQVEEIKAVRTKLKNYCTPEEGNLKTFVREPKPVTEDVEPQSSNSLNTPPPPSQNLAKAPKPPKSSAEFEMLKLTDRQTLHSLNCSRGTLHE